MEVKHTVPADFERIDVQESQVGLVDLMSWGEIEATCRAFTKSVFDNDGNVMAIAGLQEIYPERCCAWALLSKDAGKLMLPMTRLAKGVIKNCGYARVEATVHVDFEPGQRWVNMLGMEKEATLRRWFPGRTDVDMWVWFNDGN